MDECFAFSEKLIWRKWDRTLDRTHGQHGMVRGIERSSLVVTVSLDHGQPMGKAYEPLILMVLVYWVHKLGHIKGIPSLWRTQTY